MICPTCKRTTSRIRYYQGRALCAADMGLSETGGARIDGTLTRQSQRIRDQHRTNEGDMIPAHVFDHNTKALTPNPEFLKHYPEKIPTMYSPDELKKAGHSKIDKVFTAHKEQKAQHAAAASAGVTYRRTAEPST